MMVNRFRIGNRFVRLVIFLERLLECCGLLRVGLVIYRIMVVNMKSLVRRRFGMRLVRNNCGIEFLVRNL